MGLDGLADGVNSWGLSDDILCAYLLVADLLGGDSLDQVVLSAGLLSAQRSVPAGDVTDWDLNKVVGVGALLLAERSLFNSDFGGGGLSGGLVGLAFFSSDVSARSNGTLRSRSLVALTRLYGVHVGVRNFNRHVDNLFLLNNLSRAASFFVTDVRRARISAIGSTAHGRTTERRTTERRSTKGRST